MKTICFGIKFTNRLSKYAKRTDEKKVIGILSCGSRVKSVIFAQKSGKFQRVGIFTVLTALTASQLLQLSQLPQSLRHPSVAKKAELPQIFTDTADGSTAMDNS